MDTTWIQFISMMSKEYIDSIRVEQSCHEGSYIAQPYDSDTGKQYHDMMA